MIMVERLNGEKFYINPDLIEFVEATPDTVVSMTTGRKIIVKEKPEELIDHIIQYRGRIINYAEKNRNKGEGQKWI